MSEQINEFDQIIRDRLGEQTATPPPAVWENIQSSRSFGHVVANRISNNWGMFGTLLMLLLAGGSAVYLFGEEEINPGISQANTLELFENWNANTVVHPVESLQQFESYQDPQHDGIMQSSEFISPFTAESTEEIEKKDLELPAVDLLASVTPVAFARPQVQNPRISAFLENLDGWEDAKPKSFVRYYHMNELGSKGVHKNKLEPNPIDVEMEDYDYVLPKVERKTFKERTSILISLTPQIVTKLMRAEYNLSSSYLELRDKTERTRFAYTFGALMHYELKNHKFIETGVNFSQIYEEMHYEGERRFSNQYNFLEVPILFGYGDRTAKWGWEFKAGLGLQVYNTYEGYILKRIDEFGAEEVENQPLYRVGPSSTIKALTSTHSLSDNQARHEVVDLEEENPFKTTGIVNLHFAAGLVYYHSINTSFVITPSYRRSLNSITKTEALFTEKIQFMGISFGARLKFN